MKKIIFGALVLLMILVFPAVPVQARSDEPQNKTEVAYVHRERKTLDHLKRVMMANEPVNTWESSVIAELDAQGKVTRILCRDSEETIEWCAVFYNDEMHLKKLLELYDRAEACRKAGIPLEGKISRQLYALRRELLESRGCRDSQWTELCFLQLDESGKILRNVTAKSPITLEMACKASGGDISSALKDYRYTYDESGNLVREECRGFGGICSEVRWIYDQRGNLQERQEDFCVRGEFKPFFFDSYKTDSLGRVTECSAKYGCRNVYHYEEIERNCLHYEEKDGQLKLKAQAQFDENNLETHTRYYDGDGMYAEAFFYYDAMACTPEEKLFLQNLYEKGNFPGYLYYSRTPFSPNGE